MKIVNKKITDLIFAEYNPRILTSEQYEHIKSSLTRFGFVDPIIVNVHAKRKNIIVGGHQRVRVWKDMGNQSVPCVEVNLDAEREKELNIRLNKNTGEWDREILADMFNMNDLHEWGFDDDELTDGMGEVEAESRNMELYEPEPPHYTWVLIRCPTASFINIAENIEDIGKHHDIQIETAVTDE